MTATEITRMIETGDFGPEFNSYQKNKIKEAWKSGRTREAQKLVQDVLDFKQRKGKTLL